MAFTKLKLINLSQLAKLSGVSYYKIYFRKNGNVAQEMDLKDRTKIVNTIKKDIAPLFEELGFKLEINQMGV